MPALFPGTLQPLQMVRTFHYQENSGRPWVCWLLQHGYHVQVGLTITKDTLLDIANMELDYKKNKLQWDSNLLLICVGNEIVQSQLELSKTLVDVLRARIKIGALPNVKISINCNFTVPWIDSRSFYPPNTVQFSSLYLKLYKEGYIDVVLFNIYSVYFDRNAGVTLEEAISWTPGFSVVVNQIASLRNAMQKAEITAELWINETGWASALHAVDDDIWSNRKAQQTYYTGFMNADLESQWRYSIYNVLPPEKMFYFTLRDSLMGTVYEYFGLYEKDTTRLLLKQNVTKRVQ